jgi:uncharacterized metal-binding protein YceD (DUF177 family)
MTQPAQLWHVPVRLDDVPETGLHLDLIADEQVRAGLAALAGVAQMPRLTANLDIVRRGKGLRATGRVSATVEQICVVTLEPVENVVDEPIDVIFVPPADSAATDLAKDELAEEDLAAAAAGGEDEEQPEVLTDGTADVGAIAAEFLLLGIDPYPRKPGAEFTPPADQGAVISPFAALARLRDTKH